MLDSPYRTISVKFLFLIPQPVWTINRKTMQKSLFSSNSSFVPPFLIQEVSKTCQTFRWNLGIEIHFLHIPSLGSYKMWSFHSIHLSMTWLNRVEKAVMHVLNHWSRSRRNLNFSQKKTEINETNWRSHSPCIPICLLTYLSIYPYIYICKLYSYLKKNACQDIKAFFNYYLLEFIFWAKKLLKRV